MEEVKMYYADTLEDILGKQFRGQKLTFVTFNHERITEKDEEIARKYIHKQDPRIAIGWCRGQEDFHAQVEETRQTYEHGGKGLVPVIVPALPLRSRGLLAWLAEARERATSRKVNALEQAWPDGNPSNLQVLLKYLTHPNARVRETAALAIGEYLSVVVRRSGRTAIVEKAVEALLGRLATETEGDVLTNIGSSLGNAEFLTTADRLLRSLKGRSSTDVDKVAHGLQLLRQTQYRLQLLEALKQVGLSEPEG